MMITNSVWNGNRDLRDIKFISFGIIKYPRSRDKLRPRSKVTLSHNKLSAEPVESSIGFDCHYDNCIFDQAAAFNTIR